MYNRDVQDIVGTKYYGEKTKSSQMILTQQEIKAQATNKNRDNKEVNKYHSANCSSGKYPHHLSGYSGIQDERG